MFKIDLCMCFVFSLNCQIVYIRLFCGQHAKEFLTL